MKIKGIGSLILVNIRRGEFNLHLGWFLDSSQAVNAINGTLFQSNKLKMNVNIF